jgi:acetyl-CoA C-acetyltransferase
MLSAQAIQSGNAHLVITGGMESMSQTPYYLTKHRTGAKMGHQQLIDSIIIDGLWDPYHQLLMGDIAEQCAKAYKISREEQDDYAILSYKRAIDATQKGVLSEYITPIDSRPTRDLDQNGIPRQYLPDESLSRFDETKMRRLKPVFNEAEGTITAGNSSGISDGACALVLASDTKIKSLDIRPIAKIISFADAQQSSQDFPTTPSIAIEKVLGLARLSVDDIDVFEINEAFAAVVLANQKILKLPSDKLNILGGSIAIGHPLGW